MTDRGGLWFGWSGEVADTTAAQPDIEVAGKITYATMDLGREDYEPSISDMPTARSGRSVTTVRDFSTPAAHEFEGYLRVNATFAEAARGAAAAGRPDLGA